MGRGELRCCGEAARKVDTDDPMAGVADDEVVEVARVETKHSHRRSRYVRNCSKNKIIEVMMPQKAPETGINEGERVVRMYCESRKTIWLCTEDASWALQYLRDQLHVKGVRRVPAGDIGPGEAHAVPCADGPPGQRALGDWVQPP